MKSTVLLIFLFLGLAGVYFFIIPKGDTSLNEEETAFAIKDTSSIGMIVLEKIVRGEKKIGLTLEKKNGTWMVNGNYHAMKTKIRQFKETLIQIAVKEPLKNKAQTSALEILKKNHTRVTIYDESRKQMKDYYVGTTNNEQTANILMLFGAENAYLVSKPGHTGFISVEYTTSEDDWREKLLFSATKDNLSEWEVDNGDQNLVNSNSFKLKKSSPAAKSFELFVGGKSFPMDAKKVDEYLKQFTGDIYAADFAMEELHGLRDSLLKTPPLVTMKYKLFSGESGFVKLFLRKGRGESYYALTSTSPEVMIAQGYVVDKYLISGEYFKAGKEAAR